MTALRLRKSKKISEASQGETFEGVPVNDRTWGDLKNGAAFTTPLTGISFSFDFYKNDPKGRTDLLRHEYGHILQANRYGNAYFWGVVVPVSLASAWGDSNGHQQTWTEIEANTLSYLHFGMPTDWNTTEYSINKDYMNGVIQADQKNGLGPR